MFRLGIFLVIFSVMGGFLIAGGSLGALIKPGEWLIIVGTGLGSFMISNPKHIQKSVWRNVKKLFKEAPYSKEDYLKLLVFLFTFFRNSNKVSPAELESHIEHPEQSQFFLNTPILLHNKEALTFFCDYFRIITLGFEDINALDDMMEAVLNEKRTHAQIETHAILKLGDALPGIGIVAAVLGVIIAMSAAGEEATVLAARVASALIGTFAGVFLSYAIVSPIGLYLEKFIEKEVSFLACIKTAIISYISGYPPSIALEFSRQLIPLEIQPTFYELEDAINNINYPSS